MPYPQLFTPLSLGSLTLKNRLVMSQMTMNYATEEGFMTDRLIRHYLERARGGVGLILVEVTFFNHEPSRKPYRRASRRDGLLRKYGRWFLVTGCSLLVLGPCS